VTYAYTVTANGCINPTTYNVVARVNPAPAFTSTLTPAAICSGTSFAYTAVSPTAGASFSWSRAAIATINGNGAANGMGNVNETLVNTGTAPVDVTYVYSVTANGCTSAPYNVVIRINPAPALTSTLNAA